MPFPADWPPRPSTGLRSIRFFVTETATADFADRAYMFRDGIAANTYQATPANPPGVPTPTVYGDLTRGGTPMGGGPATPFDVRPGETAADVPKPMLWCQAMMIRNTGVTPLEFSFDGVSVHGVIQPGAERIYRNRYEAGVAVRGVGNVFFIEAW